MASVFVSYAREDAHKAKAIARALEDASLEVWIDERIHSGSEFASEIEQALAAATAVVVLWSKDSVTSPWVRDEAAEGRDSHRLVPIQLDDSRPPIGFRQFRTTDLSRWSGRGRPRQLDDVIAAISAKAGVERPAPVKRQRRLAGPMLWTFAALAAVLLGVGAWLATRQLAGPPSSAVSVAVLPFKADSSDADARKLAIAARDSVAHTLSQGAFAVSTIEGLPKDGRPPTDFVISGQTSGTPDKVVTTVRMEETAHGVVVFSHQFAATRAKAWDLPEQVGAQVASQLSWTAPLIALERRHPSDPAIVAALLQSSTAGLEGVNALHDYETARRLSAKAPNSPLAQNQFAFNTAFALSELPREQRREAIAAARRAADRTVELAPEYGGAYIPWCLLHSDQRMIECENRLRTAMSRDPDDPFVNWFLSRLLNNVGRNAEAAELAQLSLAHDQYMPYKIAQMIRMLAATGRPDAAAELYKQSSRWWPNNDEISWYRTTGLVLAGDFTSAQRFFNEVADKPNPIMAAINGGKLPALRGACAKAEQFESLLCMLGFGRLGDLNSAFALADKLYPSRRGKTPEEEDRIWIERPPEFPLMFLTAPSAAPMRRDPRYLALAERTGLLEYWRSGRIPDFCRPPKPEPVCRKLVGRG